MKCVVDSDLKISFGVDTIVTMKKKLNKFTSDEGRTVKVQSSDGCGLNPKAQFYTQQRNKLSQILT